MKANPKHLFLLFLSLILIVLGLVYLLNSTNWGLNSAEKLLVNRGGMNTSQFNIIIKSKIESCEYLGAIFILLGGLFLMFTILSKDFLIGELRNDEIKNEKIADDINNEVKDIEVEDIK